jgi:hypothetical protein
MMKLKRAAFGTRSLNGDELSSPAAEGKKQHPLAMLE